MNSFDPNQSLLPSVGGSITPMSGGGLSLQEGGRKDLAGGGDFLLESKIHIYMENKNMRHVLPILTSGMFRDCSGMTDLSAQEVFNVDFEKFSPEAGETTVKKKVLNYVSNLPYDIVTKSIDPEKKGSIENTPESMLKVQKYIANCKLDIEKTKITLNPGTLTITYTIPGPTGATESAGSKPVDFAGTAGMAPVGTPADISASTTPITGASAPVSAAADTSASASAAPAAGASASALASADSTISGSALTTTSGAPTPG